GLAHRVLVELDQLKTQIGPFEDGVDAARDGTELLVDLLEAAVELGAGGAQAPLLGQPLGLGLLVDLVDGPGLGPVVVPGPIAHSAHGGSLRGYGGMGDPIVTRTRKRPGPASDPAVRVRVSRPCGRRRHWPGWPSRHRRAGPR